MSLGNARVVCVCVCVCVYVCAWCYVTINGWCLIEVCNVTWMPLTSRDYNTTWLPVTSRDYDVTWLPLTSRDYNVTWLPVTSRDHNVTWLPVTSRDHNVTWLPVTWLCITWLPVTSRDYPSRRVTSWTSRSFLLSPKSSKQLSFFFLTSFQHAFPVIWKIL